MAARGDGSELRQAEEAVTVAKGQLASLEHALERDRRTLDQLIARQGADRAPGRPARGRGP